MPRKLQARPRRKYGGRKYTKGYMRSAKYRPAGSGYRSIGVAVPFPKQLFTKLAYVDSRLLTGAGAGLLKAHTYRHNNITDPDFTGTGSQVYYNDQLSPVYAMFCVYGSRIRIEATSAYNVNCPVKLLVRARKDSAIPTDYNLEEERLDSKYVLLPPNGQATKSITMYKSVASLWGKTKRQVLASPDYEAPTSTSSTSSVSNESYWTVSTYPMDPAITSSVYINVKIDYYVKFYERIPQGRS